MGLSAPSQKGVRYGFLCRSRAAGGSMDTLARLIALLVLVAASASSWGYGQVNKIAAITKTQYSFCASSNGVEIWGDTAAAACGSCNRGFGASLDTPNTCKIWYNSTAGSFNIQPQSTRVLTEPAHCSGSATDIGGGLCQCIYGFKPSTAPGQGTECEQYTCGPSGSYSPIVTPDIKVGTVGDICQGGCGYRPGSIKAGPDGQLWAVWPFKTTGEMCGGEKNAAGADTGEKNHGPEAPVRCGVDQCPGTVNGANVCVACKNTTTQGPSTSASGAQAGDPNVKGSDVKTECTASECTTTTTNRDGSGNVIGTVTKTEPKDSFCTSNPQSPLCKRSSWGGGCGAFTCDGDAVQCALSLEVHKRNCEWADYDEPTKQRGFAAMNGQLRPTGHPANEADTQTVSFAGSIDQTDRLGGGCPQDDHLTIGSASVVIPWSRACGSLQLAGQLAVAACLLAAAFIMFKT